MLDIFIKKHTQKEEKQTAFKKHSAVQSCMVKLCLQLYDVTQSENEKRKSTF